MRDQKTGAYIADNVTILGDVVLEKDCSIWFGSVLRGDRGTIRVCEGANIQDNSVLHEQTTVGRYSTVGHSAILHGCTIGDNCLVGMGAIVLDEAVIGDNCLIGAGSLVTGRTVIPPNSLVLGNPAKVVKTLTEKQIEGLRENARVYIRLAREELA